LSIQVLGGRVGWELESQNPLPKVILYLYEPRPEGGGGWSVGRFDMAVVFKLEKSKVRMGNTVGI